MPSFSNEDREENREGLGVPVVAANANQDDTDLSQELLDKLPPPSEVRTSHLSWLSVCTRPV